MVLNPNPLLKIVEEVDVFMESLVTTIPYIAKKICPAAVVGENQLVPFVVERLGGVYVNERSGD